MQSQPDTSPEVEEFYKRIRSHLNDPNAHFGQSQSCTRPSNEFQRSKNLEYGIVDKETMSKILNSYKEQQSQSSRRSEPVTCRGITGRNYSEHLHSRHGFYNMNSTRYLTEDLKIKDVDRYTFLGGLSDFKPPPNMTIQHLKENFRKFSLEQGINRAFEYLDAREIDMAQEQASKLLEIDSDNSDVRGVIGACHLLRQDHEKAIPELKRSLSGRPIRHTQILSYLADSLYLRGMSFYRRSDFNSALSSYHECLRYKNDHDGAILHKGLCETQLHNKSNLFTHRSLTYRK